MVLLPVVGERHVIEYALRGDVENQGLRAVDSPGRLDADAIDPALLARMVLGELREVHHHG